MCLIWVYSTYNMQCFYWLTSPTPSRTDSLTCAAHCLVFSLPDSMGLLFVLAGLYMQAWRRGGGGGGHCQIQKRVCCLSSIYWSTLYCTSTARSFFSLYITNSHSFPRSLFISQSLFLVLFIILFTYLLSVQFYIFTGNYFIFLL